MLVKLLHENDKNNKEIENMKNIETSKININEENYQNENSNFYTRSFVLIIDIIQFLEVMKNNIS